MPVKIISGNVPKDTNTHAVGAATKAHYPNNSLNINKAIIKKIAIIKAESSIEQHGCAIVNTPIKSRNLSLKLRKERYPRGPTKS